MTSQWDIPVAAQVTRRQVKAKYGGSRFGGIQPSATTNNLLVYSDPEEDKEYGYDYDGWDPDNEIFLYTGEGHTGDQAMRRNNKSLLEHDESGKALRLFVADGMTTGFTEKVHRYLGEFRLDEIPYTIERSLGRDGVERSIFVFRLRPVGEYLHRDSDTSGLADSKAKAEASTIPLEDSSADTFAVPGGEPRTAEKREFLLVERYRATLTAAGHNVVRWGIKPPGQLMPLHTDLYDETENELYEVKGTSSREDVRMAVGQLLDYRRHIKAGAHLTVLLPHQPSQDVLDFVHSVGFTLVYEHGGAYIRCAPGQGPVQAGAPEPQDFIKPPSHHRSTTVEALGVDFEKGFH